MPREEPVAIERTEAGGHRLAEPVTLRPGDAIVMTFESAGGEGFAELDEPLRVRLAEPTVGAVIVRVGWLTRQLTRLGLRRCAASRSSTGWRSPQS